VGRVLLPAGVRQGDFELGPSPLEVIGAQGRVAEVERGVGDRVAVVDLRDPGDFLDRLRCKDARAALRATDRGG